MSRQGTTLVNGSKNRIAEHAADMPRCLAIASNGITSGQQVASLMSALMSDLIEGRITPNVGQATVNACGKLLKVAELNIRYGTSTVPGARKNLELVAPE